MFKKLIYSVCSVVVLSMVGSASAGLPAGWSSRDLGSPIASGSANYDDAEKTWTVSGDGHDIWGSSDAFHFAYIPLSGDGMIVARVLDNGSGSDSWAKGGVMIRETLDANSKHAMMIITGGAGAGKAFQCRQRTGGYSFSSHGGTQVSPPMWVELVREGNLFTGYYSVNGADWQQQPNPVEINMTTDVYIGLCVTSVVVGEVRTFMLDNVSIELPKLALRPNPADGALYEDTSMSLSWEPGANTVSHDVYLGDNFSDVKDGTGGTFRGNQTETYFLVGSPGYPHPDGLVSGTTYYWRVDEVEADGITIYKGDVWSFAISPKTTYEPEPANGAEYVYPNVELSWSPGFGAQLHIVYFGDSFDDVNIDAGGFLQETTTYTTGALEWDKVYYWRVDEFDGDIIHKGDIWSFRTMPEIDPTLIGWWKFDEGSGTIAYDSSGNGNDGTFNGDPQWVPGQFGYALEFDGSGDWLDCGENPSFQITDAATIAAWIKVGAQGIDHKIAGNQDDANGGYKMTIFRNNRVEFEIRTATNSFVLNRNVSGGTEIMVDVWYHVSGVYSLEGGYIRTYVNGVLDREMRTTDVLGSSPGSLKIGCEPFMTGSYNFNGVMDDLRIYSRALREAEILAAMGSSPVYLYALSPKPADGALNPNTWVNLSWLPGGTAVSHDVYFGDNFDEVEAGTEDTFQGNQTATYFVVGSARNPYLVPGVTYYWRIDEVEDDGVTVHKGKVWSFSIPLKTTHIPKHFEITYYDNYNYDTGRWDAWQGTVAPRDAWDDKYLADDSSGKTVFTDHAFTSRAVFDLRGNLFTKDGHASHGEDWNPLKSIGDNVSGQSAHHVFAVMFKGLVYLEEGDILRVTSDDDAFVFLDDNTKWGQEVLSVEDIPYFGFDSMRVSAAQAGYHMMTVKFIEVRNIHSGIEITLNGEPIRSVEVADMVTVPGTACVFFAGQDQTVLEADYPPDPMGPGDHDNFHNDTTLTTNSMPPFIEVYGGTKLSISASGVWGHCTGCTSGPNGYDYPMWVPTHDEYVILGGISRVTANRNTLLGVFLTDEPPDPGAMPPELTSPTTTPLLQQAFPIGTSLDNITIPEGATRLFFGLNDGFEWNNNVGSMEVAVNLPSFGPEPPGDSKTPEGFDLYLDDVAPNIVKTNYITKGILDYYSQDNPASGDYCIHWTEADLWNMISFRFSPVKDLSVLVDEGYAVDFWVRCDTPNARILIRFMDTNTNDPDDHPWRIIYPIDRNVAVWDGRWNHLQIPLDEFYEQGSYDFDDDRWYNPIGAFDWTATEHFEIVAEYSDLIGIDFYFDDIRVLDPNPPTGFDLYLDDIAPDIIESSMISNGLLDFYYGYNPASGDFCIHWSGADLYNNISFRFSTVKDLSKMVEEGYVVDFWVRCSSPNVKFDIGFVDTKTDREDHPWQNRFKIDRNVAVWDGRWNHLQIPLNSFYMHGSWDNDRWYEPSGEFDWTATEYFLIVAEDGDLQRVDLYFDEIRVVHPRLAGQP